MKKNDAKIILLYTQKVTLKIKILEYDHPHYFNMAQWRK